VFNVICFIYIHDCCCIMGFTTELQSSDGEESEHYIIHVTDKCTDASQLRLLSAAISGCPSDLTSTAPVHNCRPQFSRWSWHWRTVFVSASWASYWFNKYTAEATPKTISGRRCGGVAIGSVLKRINPLWTSQNFVSCVKCEHSVCTILFCAVHRTSQGLAVIQNILCNEAISFNRRLVNIESNTEKLAARYEKIPIISSGVTACHMREISEVQEWLTTWQQSTVRGS